MCGFHSNTLSSVGFMYFYSWLMTFYKLMSYMVFMKWISNEIKQKTKYFIFVLSKILDRNESKIDNIHRQMAAR